MTGLKSVRRRLKKFFQASLRLNNVPYDLYDLDRELDLFFAGKFRLRWDPEIKCLVCEQGDFN